MNDDDAPPPPVIKSTIKARGGVTGHNVRYVLAFALAGDVPQIDRCCSEYDSSIDALSDAKRRIDDVYDKL